MKSGEMAAEAISHALAIGDVSEATLQPYDARLREQMEVIYPLIYRWYEVLRNPREAVQLFELATRFFWLGRRVNAILTGAWDAVLHDPELKFNSAFRPRVGRTTVAVPTEAVSTPT
jgi:flavin-dependent dehydrogenase